jgi:hypothetical protein
MPKIKCAVKLPVQFFRKRNNKSTASCTHLFHHTGYDATYVWGIWEGWELQLDCICEQGKVDFNHSMILFI